MSKSYLIYNFECEQKYIIQLENMRCAKASHASGRYTADVTSVVGLILAEHLIHAGTFSLFRHQKLNFSCLS